MSQKNVAQQSAAKQQSQQQTPLPDPSSRFFFPSSTGLGTSYAIGQSAQSRYTIWQYQTKAMSWTQVKDVSGPGYQSAGPPRHQGKYDGQNVRVISVPRDVSAKK